MSLGPSSPFFNLKGQSYEKPAPSVRQKLPFEGDFQPIVVKRGAFNDNNVIKWNRKQNILPPKNISKQHSNQDFLPPPLMEKEAKSIYVAHRKMLMKFTEKLEEVMFPG